MKKANNKFYQRVLALVLAVMLCVGMMPMAVLATDGCTHPNGTIKRDNPEASPYFYCEDCKTRCNQVEGNWHKVYSRTVSATCTEGEYTESWCDCGYYSKTYNTEARGHDWSDWEVIEKPTYTKEGLMRRVCSRGDKVEEQPIPKLEQKFFELKISYYDIDDGKFIADGDTHGHIAEGAVITGDQYLKGIPSGYEYANKLEGLDSGDKMPAHDTDLIVFCKAITPEKPTFYKLTVHYWKEGEDKAYRSETQQVKAGSDISKQFNDGKEVPDGYYFEKIVGDSTMPPKDYELNVYYALYRTVTIHYLEEGTGNILRDKAEISVKKGESISADSPEIPGYTPDKGKVEFDNIQEDKTATVWYSLTQIGYKYTVSWFDRETGEKIKDSVVRSIEAGNDIRIDSDADKTVEGYTFCPDDSDLSVPAENVAANGNTELKLVFTKNYTVTYNSNDGTNKTDATTVVTSGTDVILKTLEQLGWDTREGWRFLGWGVEAGATDVLDSTLKIVENMNLFAVWEQIDYTVTYTWNLPAGADRTLPTDQSYKAGEPVTVDTEFTSTSTVTVGDRTYTFSGWDRTGNFTMPAGNVTINGTWRDTTPTQPDIPADSSTPTPTSTPSPTPTPSNSPEPTESPEPTTDIPDPEPPLTDSPDVTPNPEPSEPPVQIPEEDPPLAEIPDDDPPLAETPDGTTEIDDEEVPLADVPKTGDDAKIWLTLALLSAAGLGVLGLTQRRTRKDGKNS